MYPERDGALETILFSDEYRYLLNISHRFYRRRFILCPFEVEEPCLGELLSGLDACDQSIVLDVGRIDLAACVTIVNQSAGTGRGSIQCRGLHPESTCT